MFGTVKLRDLTWFVILSSLLVSCGSQDSGNDKKAESIWYEIVGRTQGTTYHIILDDESKKISEDQIDALLHQFDLALSTYVDNSIVSTVNSSSDSIQFTDSSQFFSDCYFLSREIYELTNGAFDPSVYPLVKAWGFFGDELWVQSDQDVNDILEYVGFEDGKLHELVHLEENNYSFRKTHSEFKLDFNAVAQGLSVDVLADYLDALGVKNYYVEIGGELRVKGKNKEGKNWRIGIDSPNQKGGGRIIENIVHVSNKAVATSGNYRKFYIKDGVKYAHTINPKNGKPVQHSLLSATVIANSCAEADAYATAFMVMGVDESLKFLKEHPELEMEAYLLYDEGDGEIKRAMSSSFKSYLK